MINARIAGISLLATLLGSLARQAGPEPLLQSDPELAAGLQRLLAATNEADHRRAFDGLRASAGPGHERLVRQLFLTAQEATDTREAMLFGWVVAALPIPDRDVVGALVPLLESTDAKLRAEVGNVLSEYEDRSLDRGASFTAYRTFLPDPPLGLARHLFEVDPGAALLALARAQVTDPAELRSLLWAEHEVADALWKLRFGFVQGAELARAAPSALDELRRLSDHPRWWVRLYAARVAASEPALRAAVNVEALRGDEHPLVREAASAAETR
jgi:hypothetical protein